MGYSTADYQHGGVVLHKISPKWRPAKMNAGGDAARVLERWPGRNVHVVTVNDYLARRDSNGWGRCNSSTDCRWIARTTSTNINPIFSAPQASLYVDITFGTNNEFGFDYLRDNMAFSPDDLVQRKHHYAIVDEVDSVLTDDARRR